MAKFMEEPDTRLAHSIKPEREIIWSKDLGRGEVPVCAFWSPEGEEYHLLVPYLKERDDFRRFVRLLAALHGLIAEEIAETERLVSFKFHYLSSV